MLNPAGLSYGVKGVSKRQFETGNHRAAMSQSGSVRENCFWLIPVPGLESLGVDEMHED